MTDHHDNNSDRKQTTMNHHERFDYNFPKPYTTSIQPPDNGGPIQYDLPPDNGYHQNVTQHFAAANDRSIETMAPPLNDLIMDNFSFSSQQKFNSNLLPRTCCPSSINRCYTHVTNNCSGDINEMQSPSRHVDASTRMSHSHADVCSNSFNNQADDGTSKANGYLGHLPCQQDADWNYDQCYSYYAYGCYNTCQFVQMGDMEDFILTDDVAVVEYSKEGLEPSSE